MVSESLRRLVRERAQGRCEYCLMSQALQGAAFHLEHIVPLSKGGQSTPENLALPCPSCNLGKADAVESRDPDTGRLVKLFDPREDRWASHFSVEGVRILGLTPTGRATAVCLGMNTDRRLRIREVERALGWWPPPAGD